MNLRTDRSTKAPPHKTDVPEPQLESHPDADNLGPLTSDPTAITPGQALQLQRLIGNRAVQRMVSQTDAVSEPPLLQIGQRRTETDTNPAVASLVQQAAGTHHEAAIQRWDWGGAGVGAGIGAGIGATIGGFLGGPLGAVAGGLLGGLAGGVIGGLVTKPTVDPKQAIKEAAESLVDIGGTASEADKQVVVAEMIKIPLPALEALKKKGTRVVVCHDSVTEIRQDLQGVQPRGWPPGKTWDSVPGLFDSQSNRVIIATRGGQVPATGDGHGSHNLVLHEVGHAIGEAATVGGEDDPRFIAAREKDKAALDNYEGQQGHAGIEETYAESFARFHDNDPNDARVYPNLHAYWASNPFIAGGS